MNKNILPLNSVSLDQFSGITKSISTLVGRLDDRAWKNTFNYKRNVSIHPSLGWTFNLVYNELLFVKFNH